MKISKNQNNLGNTNNNSNDIITSLSNNNNNIRSMYTSTKKPISYSIDNKNKPYNIQYKLETAQITFLKSVLKLPSAELETMGITFKIVTRIVEILNRDRYRDYDLEMLNKVRNQYILREKLRQDLFKN